MCSNCKHELKKIPHNGMEMNQCASCDGIWFNYDDLRNAKDKEDEFLRWLDVDLFSDPLLFKGGYSTMSCPNDREPLYEIFYDNSEIKVDVCKKCKGVWLDKNEFNQVVAFLKRSVFSDTTAEYLKHLEDQIKEIFVGKEHLASEIKDAYIVWRLLENRIISQWPRIEEIIIPLRAALLK